MQQSQARPPFHVALLGLPREACKGTGAPSTAQAPMQAPPPESLLPHRRAQLMFQMPCS